MPERTLMISLVVPRFFPLLDDDNKLESNLDVNALTEVKTSSSYDFLGTEEPTVDDESYYIHPSLDSLHASELLGGFIT